MSPQQIEGLTLCLTIVLMTLAICPMVVWGIKGNSI